MDIAAYLIQFLIKNKYCSLPSIGTFTLSKKPAAITDKEIIAPKYIVEFSHLGSIDDQFANYCAAQENVSISNASNHIKTFCNNIRDAVKNNERFQINGLGFLAQGKEHIVFEQTDELDLGNINQALPPLVSRSQGDKKIDFSYPPAYLENRVSKQKVLLRIAIISVVVLGIIFSIYYFIKNSDSVHTSTAKIENNTNNVSPVKDSITVSQNTTPISNTSTPALHKVALYETTLQANAEAKSAKWKKYGNMTEVIASDNNFIVCILASHPQNDTTLLIDSLRRFFNPKGKPYIMK